MSTDKLHCDPWQCWPWLHPVPVCNHMTQGEPIVTKYFTVAANKKPGTRSCQQEVVNVYLVDSCDLGLDELVVFYVIGCEVSAFIV